MTDWANPLVLAHAALNYTSIASKPTFPNGSLVLRPTHTTRLCTLAHQKERALSKVRTSISLMLLVTKEMLHASLSHACDMSVNASRFSTIDWTNNLMTSSHIDMMLVHAILEPLGPCILLVTCQTWLSVVHVPLTWLGHTLPTYQLHAPGSLNDPWGRQSNPSRLSSHKW